MGERRGSNDVAKSSDVGGGGLKIGVGGKGVRLCSFTLGGGGELGLGVLSLVRILYLSRCTEVDANY